MYVRLPKPLLARNLMITGVGLKFDDLMIEEEPDVAEAVRRLTPEQQLARKRRQLRAFDISLKKTPLPDHIQAVQEPFEVSQDE